MYDEETWLYYLRSRYYFPEFGRFINGDIVIGEAGELGSHNLYAYCKNNPLVCVDASGQKTHVITGTYTGAFLGVVSYSTGICWDDAGNFAFIKTYIGTEGAVGVGLWNITVGNSYQRYSNATVPDLIGAATMIGGSGGAIGSFGGDLIQLENDFGTNVINGSQTTIGLSIGMDYSHVENTITYLMFKKYKGVSVPKALRRFVSKDTISQWVDSMDEYIKTIPVPSIYYGPTPAPGPAPAPSPSPSLIIR